MMRSWIMRGISLDPLGSVQRRFDVIFNQVEPGKSLIDVLSSVVHGVIVVPQWLPRGVCSS